MKDNELMSQIEIYIYKYVFISLRSTVRPGGLKLED